MNSDVAECPSGLGVESSAECVRSPILDVIPNGGQRALRHLVAFSQVSDVYSLFPNTHNVTIAPTKA